MYAIWSKVKELYISNTVSTDSQNRQE